MQRVLGDRDKWAGFVSHDMQSAMDTSGKPPGPALQSNPKISSSRSPFLPIMQRREVDLGWPSRSWNHRGSVLRELEWWRKPTVVGNFAETVGGAGERKTLAYPLLLFQSPTIDWNSHAQQEATCHRSLGKHSCQDALFFHFSPTQNEQGKAKQGISTWPTNWEMLG